jgi:hypothetical protein
VIFCDNRIAVKGLILFGDQAKKSVNNIGTSNEINGYISNMVIYHILYQIYVRYFTMELDMGVFRRIIVFFIILEILYSYIRCFW